MEEVDISKIKSKTSFNVIYSLVLLLFVILYGSSRIVFQCLELLKFLSSRDGTE